MGLDERDASSRPSRSRTTWGTRRSAAQGQDALDECMRDHGNFEHNLQSLRVVDELELRYPDFDGLNLTLETREGILKRCNQAQALELEAAEPGGVGQRFLAGRQTSLEAPAHQTSPTRSRTTRTMSTTACAPGCSMPSSSRTSRSIPACVPRRSTRIRD